MMIQVRPGASHFPAYESRAKVVLKYDDRG